MAARTLLIHLTGVLLLALILNGCGKSSSSSDTGNTAANAAFTGLEKEAADAAISELNKHWAKSADGWTTSLNEGSDFAPIYFLRQMRELSVGRIEANELDDSDRLNGFEWAGNVWLKKSPAREVGDPSVVLGGLANATVMRQFGQWSQWLDYEPMPLRVQKVKGKWAVRTDNNLVTGTIPTPADYARTKMK